MQKLKTGDNVKVISGKDKGKEGKILSFEKKDGKVVRVVVEGINKVKRAEKPNAQFGIPGGIKEFEKSIDISNVMLSNGGAVSRVGISFDDKGKKTRVFKKDKSLIK